MVLFTRQETLPIHGFTARGFRFCTNSKMKQPSEKKMQAFPCPAHSHLVSPSVRVRVKSPANTFPFGSQWRLLLHLQHRRGLAELADISRFYHPRQGEGPSQGVDSINMFAKVLLRLGPTPLLTELRLIYVYYIIRMYFSSSERGAD